MHYFRLTYDLNNNDIVMYSFMGFSYYSQPAVMSYILDIG